MSATTKWDSPARPEERRGSPRVKVSSLIYAQLGSDNGGIVLNLGMDGLACHAAHNLIGEKNSVINLRLRGSGLNEDITGELVWLAGTQKEVGISFKSLPTHVRRNISDWIDRESQPVTHTSSEQTGQRNTISAIADFVVPEKRTVLRSLSAALALSRATSMDGAMPTREAAEQADPSLPVKSSAGIFPLAPTAGTFHLTENSNPVERQIKDQEQLIESISPIALESSNKNLLPNSPSIAVEPPASEVGQSHAEVKKEMASPQEPAKIAHSLPKHALVEIRNKVKIGKNTVAKSIAGAPISAALRRSYAAVRAEKWIPQAFLSAWKGLSVQQKKLLTHIGSGCIGLLIGIILILAVTLSHGSSGRSPQSKPSPKSTIPLVSPELETGDLHDRQDQEVPTKSAISPGNQSHSIQPQPSLFSKIVNGIFGNEPDGTPKISDYQMGLEVWTSQSTGYYYCSDDPYAKQVQPGSPMLQGDALQAGYRPRLGQFCN
ncbi:MAG TPA: PilZ domain-containing protein [Candidatus Acidoferrales bacterium]|nr:PilZ domain-containing protein [Candidatus Acidoferrales bacterium]